MEKRYKGSTLLESIMAVLILALTMVALTNLFSVSRRLITHSRSQLGAGGLGRLFLDPLQGQVRQDQWGGAGNCLSAGIGCPGNQTVGNIIYNPAYNITNVPIIPGVNLRRVRAQINWVEQ